jgi:hypothetical protein
MEGYEVNNLVFHYVVDSEIIRRIDLANGLVVSQVLDMSVAEAPLGGVGCSALESEEIFYA